MTAQLVIAPAGEGWQVSDIDQRLPISWYERLEEALQEAREYLAYHGGGSLLIREASRSVREEVVEPHGLSSDPIERRATHRTATLRS